MPTDPSPLYTADDYQKLKKAIALGAVQVEYADKKVTYRSLTEMKQLLADMADELGYNKPGGGRHFGEFSKGLC